MSQSCSMNAFIATKQRMMIDARQLSGIRILGQTLPELRTELYEEIRQNPVIEDISYPLEVPMTQVDTNLQQEARDSEPDYPADEPIYGSDEEANEKHQRLLDNQVKEETLQEHLMAQVPYTDIPEKDWSLVEVLVGDLNDDGFYIGSIPDVVMSFGRTEADVARLLEEIGHLDPLGCGARTARECLLFQLEELDGSPERYLVGEVVENHLVAFGKRQFDDIAKALGITLARMDSVARALRTLNPHPGRAFPGERSRMEYINPEVHAVRRNGRWEAVTDVRSRPEIHVSQRYLKMLDDPSLEAETRQYIMEKVARIRQMNEDIARRQQTIETISTLIFERQQEFFEKGFGALKPLTEAEVAKAVGVDPSTVSRTVREKYASTKWGTMALRRFFVSGFTAANGRVVSQEAVLVCLKDLVDKEDKAHPLSDSQLVEALTRQGYTVARRTVVKYRSKLGIPTMTERKV